MMRLLENKTIFIFISCAGVLCFAGCGNDASNASASASSPPQANTAAASKNSEQDAQRISAELQQLEKDIKAALDEEDWTRTKQLVAQGLEIIEENTGDFELYKANFLLARATRAREQSRETEARRYFTDAMAIFHVHQNAKGKFQAHLGLGKLEARRGDYAAAGREFEEAESLLADVDDALLKGIFQLEMGQLASKKVKRQKAKQNFLDAIAVFESERDKKHLAEALMYLAHEEDALGNSDQSRRRLSRALSLFREMENLEGEAHSLHRLARLAEREKKYNHARTLLKKVHALYDKLDRKADMLRVERHINSLPEQE